MEEKLVHVCLSILSFIRRKQTSEQGQKSSFVKQIYWALHVSVSVVVFVTSHVVVVLFLSFLFHIFSLFPSWWSALRNWFFWHIKDNIPASLDPHQYAFRTNRSTEDAIATTLHSLHVQNSYIRMLFVDFNSTFNRITPMKLIGKLSNMGLRNTIC